jgi:CRP-like cAMP-binding protein
MTRLTLDSLPPLLKTASQDEFLHPQQILFQQGDLAEGVYFLRNGQIRLVNFISDQVVNNCFVDPGESFAESTPFYETYPYTAIADRKSKVVKIPKQLFLETLHQDFNFCKSFMRQLVYRFDTTQKILTLRSIRSARERVLQYLVMNRQSHELAIKLQRPLKDIASELGLVPEVLSRTLTSLRNEGVIDRDRQYIYLNIKDTLPS